MDFSRGWSCPDFFQSSGPFRGVKRDLYEGGIRLPLIVYSPGKIKAGVRNNQVCAMWDMMPTLASVAGVKLPKNLKTDGLSILPSLTGKGKQKQHEFLYWEFHEQGGKIAIRKGDWKLIVLNVLKSKSPKTELYNLASYIHENNNVAAQHPDLVKEMLQLMKNARVESEIFKFNSETKIF